MSIEKNEVTLHGNNQRGWNIALYLPEFVYWWIDGLVTTFAVVAWATWANLDLSVVLILGFANLFADGFSMSIGAYLANKSEHDNYKKHLAIEYREIEHLREKEVQEVRDIYAAKWFEGELLEQVVAKIIEDNDRRVDVMMKEELGINEPDKTPLLVGWSTLIAFVVIGLIPLLTYVIAYTADLDPKTLFPIAIWLTALWFVGIGWMKSYINETSHRKGVLETVSLWGLAAAVAYYVWFVLEKIIVG
jgi:VIT1/CCC1 family predicted Fe2+/Mn2+ transporter